MTDSPLASSPAIRWTPQQQRVIDHRSGNLAVSASAGSGKTAVLTERVLCLLTGQSPTGVHPPVPLDRMLIITFTEKAAREMRERIERRLRDRLADDPDQPLLREALDQIPASWIMTIDAFCRRLVLDHFHRAGVAPDPYVPDQAELAQLEETVMRRLLEEWAADPQQHDQLLEAQQCYGQGLDELTAQARMLMRFLEALDQPTHWIREVGGKLRLTAAADRFDGLPELYQAGKAFHRATNALAASLTDVVQQARNQKGCDEKIVKEWARMAEGLHAIARESLAFDRIRKELRSDYEPMLGKLGLKKICGAGFYADPSFRKHVLEAMSRRFNRWLADWFTLDEAGMLDGARHAARQGLLLLDLAQTGIDRLAEERKRRGWITFNDFERFALDRVLSDPDRPGEPSDAAQFYREQFQHVLVDEYQDTSPLQDALVRRVANPDAPGNLFLVGDYKQSIYRFRFAEPDLFHSVLKQDQSGFDVIRLDRNFRSRPGILHAVNAIFGRLMDREIGDVDYREAETLVPDRVDPPGFSPVSVEVQWLIPSDAPAADDADEPDDEPDDEEDASKAPVVERLAGAEAQAAWVARRIREWTGPNGLTSAQNAAPLRPGDCAILLRSIRAELNIWVRALEREGLKVRAGGINPLLTASELLDLQAALRVADNPLQDHALAALMRSPMGGFSDDDLLLLRMQWIGPAFYRAVWQAAGRPLPGGDSKPATPPAAPLPDDLTRRLAAFMTMLDGWRAAARRLDAEDVLDRILRDTDYLATLAGYPDAALRLEHVDFLRRLLRKLGSAADGANPLGAFLERLDRAMDNDEVIGELPEPVGSAGDAVNLLTIHGSKGLEFPIVFLPRLERHFRKPKISDLLLDRAEQMALRGVDPVHRCQYPTLGHRVLADTVVRRERSEELRLLYVAMTRARERLVLVARVPKPEILAEKARQWMTPGDRPFPALDRLMAASPLDLIGPVIHGLAAAAPPPAWLVVHPAQSVAASDTKIEREWLKQALTRTGQDPQADWLGAIESLRAEAGEVPISLPTLEPLPTIDPARALTRLPLKTTVTQLRQAQNPPAAADDPHDATQEDSRFVETEMRPSRYRTGGDLSMRRPQWAGADRPQPSSLDGALRGTLVHAVLAQTPLDPSPTLDTLRQTALDVIDRRRRVENWPDLDAGALAEQLDLPALVWFFETEWGRRMCAHPRATLRELPFTTRKGLGDFDPAAAAAYPHEFVLLQGVADVVIDEGERITILDYKTDRIGGDRTVERLAAHYELQLRLYAQALRAIWRPRRIDGALIFLNARQVHPVEALHP